jgi:hypothetical protein
MAEVSTVADSAAVANKKDRVISPSGHRIIEGQKRLTSGDPMARSPDGCQPDKLWSPSHSGKTLPKKDLTTPAVPFQGAYRALYFGFVAINH